MLHSYVGLGKLSWNSLITYVVSGGFRLNLSKRTKGEFRTMLFTDLVTCDAKKAMGFVAEHMK
jgi:hypothetical protein